MSLFLASVRARLSRLIRKFLFLCYFFGLLVRAKQMSSEKKYKHRSCKTRISMRSSKRLLSPIVVKGLSYRFHNPCISHRQLDISRGVATFGIECVTQKRRKHIKNNIKTYRVQNITSITIFFKYCYTRVEKRLTKLRQMLATIIYVE